MSNTMEITIQRTDLVRVLGAVSRAVEKRNTIPILSHVLLAADGDTLTARGTDLDIEVSAHATAVVATAGSCAVDASRLSDIVKKMVGETVSLVLDKDKLTVKAGRSRFTLPTLDAADYPTLNVGEFDHTFAMDLSALFAPVQFAMSSEETRYYLNGVYLHVSGSELRAVATDGHRLALNKADIPEGATALPGIIVPRKTVGLIAKGMVDVSISKTKIRVSTNDTVLTSKLIDGAFPDYMRVIPTGNDKLLRLDRAEFAKAVSRVATVASERGRAIRLDIANDNLALSVKSDSGEAYEDVTADFTAEPLAAGFNSAYLSELLGVLSGAEVKIALNDPGSPALLTGEGTLLAVLMPMRVA